MSLTMMVMHMICSLFVRLSVSSLLFSFLCMERKERRAGIEHGSCGVTVPRVTNCTTTHSWQRMVIQSSLCDISMRHLVTILSCFRSWNTFPVFRSFIWTSKWFQVPFTHALRSSLFLLLLSSSVHPPSHSAYNRLFRYYSPSILFFNCRHDSRNYQFFIFTMVHIWHSIDWI